MPSGHQDHNLRLSLVNVPDSGHLDDLLNRPLVLEGAADDDQQVVAKISQGSGHDRSSRRVANRHHHDRGSGECPCRHAEARPAEVEAADDHDGDRRHDQRQRPGCQERLPDRLSPIR